jgi:hypothetical protein
VDDVEITLLRHIAGDYDAALGQLCMRCGVVLDGGLQAKGWPHGTEPARGFPPGRAVMVSTDSGGRFRCPESALLPDRDRSDEADCISVA